VNLTAMMDNKLLNYCDILSGRKFADEDILIDIKFLQDELGKNVQDLSSLDEYASELRSGRLEWSPVHKSEVFWRQNAARLNENNYEMLKYGFPVLFFFFCDRWRCRLRRNGFTDPTSRFVSRMLGKILNHSTNSTSLAVACHDVGQYVKYSAWGKQYVSTPSSFYFIFFFLLSRWMLFPPCFSNLRTCLGNV
jgi:V-type H+-transporting ATPase subunit H